MEPHQRLSEDDSYVVFWNAEHRFRVGASQWKARQAFGYVHVDSHGFEINTGVDDLDSAGNINRTYAAALVRAG